MSDSFSEKKLTSSAIGSWAGYIYQGLCGLYHCIYLLTQDKNNKTLRLSLDAFEDFSILNNNHMIVSLHQCKDIKKRTDYETDYQLMVRKHEEYVKSHEADPSCKMYFHANEDVSPIHPIEAYKYGAKQTIGLKPNDVFMQLEYITNEYLNNNGLSGDSSMVVAKCLRIIDEKIFIIQQEYFDSKSSKLKTIARKHFIPLKSLFDILESEAIELSLRAEDIASWIKMRYHVNLLSKINTAVVLGKDSNANEIEDFLDKLNKLEHHKSLHFFQRVNPNVDLSILSLNTYVEAGSKSIINSLWKVINDIGYLNENLSWSKKGYHITPSSLNTSNDVDEYCCEIYNNRANLDVLREYRWIVGNINESVFNIRAALDLISYIPYDRGGVEEFNIFKENEVGLITINDFQDERYI